jgi:hypothetical protein
MVKNGAGAENLSIMSQNINNGDVVAQWGCGGSVWGCGGSVGDVVAQLAKATG